MIKENLSLLPYKLQNKLSFLFNNLSDLENILFGINKIQINKPIFICGSPRSGTTLITHILNQHKDLGSFEYKDLPFYKIPIIWSKINKIYYGKVKPSPRIHGDDLSVGLDSPDAFEELIWKNYIDQYQNYGFCNYLDENYNNKNLYIALNAYIKKILFLRKKKRYLSKGNYNIFRLPYILKNFPSAKIIICCRGPTATAESLLRVHSRFIKIAKEDSTFKQKLIELCHYEFGPQRKAILTEKNNFEKIINFWNKNDDFNGYLQQWLCIYKMVNERYLRNKKISKNIFLLDHDKFMNNQKIYLSKLLNFCGLESDETFFKQKIELNKKIKESVNYKIDENLYKEVGLVYKTLEDFINSN